MHGSLTYSLTPLFGAAGSETAHLPIVAEFLGLFLFQEDPVVEELVLVDGSYFLEDDNPPWSIDRAFLNREQRANDVPLDGPAFADVDSLVRGDAAHHRPENRN